jgi:uncharacterized protein
VRLRERIASGLLGAYKYAISPLLHAVSGVAGACRFQPTCSEYAAIAVSEYGILRGGWMALRRLSRCHPFCRGGFDPVSVNQSHHGERSSPGTRHLASPRMVSTKEPHHQAVRNRNVVWQK